MDTAKFYELRKRLYLAAASGTQTLTEDFRLKRAVEEFGAEMASSKPMMKLYHLCVKLFSAEGGAGTLAECLALADALAVVQCGYSDKAEAEPSSVDYNYEFADTQLKASDIDKIERYMTKVPIEILFNSEITPAVIKDPRVLSAFLRSLNKMKLPESAIAFTENYGESLVPILKTYMKNAPDNAAVNCIRLLRIILGARGNQFFTDLVKNTENPSKIRAAAAEAMDCCYENVPFLLDLYNTENGKVKRGALAALGRLDPPEAEEIWVSQLEKRSESTDKLLSAAHSHVITEYVRDDIFIAINYYESWDDKYWVYRLIDLLKSKTDCADILIKLLNHDLYSGRVIELLVDNLRMYPYDTRYRKLIHDVAVHTHKGAPAWMFMDIIQGGNFFSKNNGKLSEDFECIVHIMENISYSPSMEKFLLPFSYSNPNCGFWAVVNAGSLDRMTEYFSDTGLFSHFKSIEHNPIKRIKTAKSIGGEEKLKDCFEKLLAMASSCCKCLEKIAPQRAVEFALFVSGYCPSVGSVEVLRKSTALDPENSRGIFAAYVIFLARHFTAEQAASNSKYSEAEQLLDMLPLTAEQKLAELADINKKLRLPALSADKELTAELKKQIGLLTEKYKNEIREESK